MRRLLDLRVVRWERKLAAAIVVWLVGMALFALLPAEIPSPLRSALALIVNVGSFVLCARVFRGRGEPVAPPRAWWRMTARARLSARLGLLFSLLTLLGLVVLFASVVGITGPITGPGGAEDVAASAIDILQTGTLAFLYLNSASRLRGMPAPTEPPIAPSFRPPRALR
jgi:hypothetical protein